MGPGRVLHWRMVDRFFACAGRMKCGAWPDSLRYGIWAVPGRSHKVQPGSIPQGHGANRQLSSRWDFDRVSWPPTLTHWFLRYRAVSWTSRNRGGEAKVRHRKTRQPPTPRSLQGLAPVRVSMFKSRLRRHHASVLHSSEGGSSPCSVRSLPDLFDVCPPENRTFQMMCNINWQEVSVRC